MLTGAAAGAAAGAIASQPANAESSKPSSSNTSGYSKPGTEPSTSTSSAPPRSALNEAAQRTMSRDSLSQYQRERAEATAPPKPVNADQIRRDPVFTESRRQYSSVDDYMSQRRRHVEDYRQRYPEAYRYNQGMSPNYGMFDSNFLMGLMLGHLGSSSNSNAAWMNSQRDQEWYRQWRADLDKKAQENSELKARLERMDSEMAELRSQKDKLSTTALPQGVPGSLAIAPDAVIAAEDKYNGIGWMWILLLLASGGAMLWHFNRRLVTFYRRDHGTV